MLTVPSTANLRAWVANRRQLITAGGWFVGMFFVLQVMRLGTNIGLAHMLAPELLGMMALINTLRTGGELLSDIGIGQSIVQSNDGQKPFFYNTAWTMQIIRGVLLYAVALLAVTPLADLYDDPLLMTLLPVAALVFIVSGCASPARFLLQKEIAAKRIFMYRFKTSMLSTIIHLGLAWYLQSIWALVLALLISAVLETIMGFFLINWRLHHLQLDRGAARSIFKFGKWVFLSTLVYFLASNFDRLYLAEAVSFAALGVYGIARTFSDTAMNLAQQLSSHILFPKVSNSPLRGELLRQAIIPSRRIVVWLIALAMAGGIAIADRFIQLAYDPRWHDAAFYLPVLLAGGWFAMLSAFSESILMGIGKPSNVALGNAAKFAAILIIVPYVLPRHGLGVTVMVFSGVEVVRYALLAIRERAHGLSFWVQDAGATAGFIVLAIVFREITGLLGLTTGLAGWGAMVGEALAG